MTVHLRAMGRQLPNGIPDLTVLPATRHKWKHPALIPNRLLLDLPTAEGWKAELTIY